MRLDDYQRAITDAVLDMRRDSNAAHPRNNPGVSEADPWMDSGVRTPDHRNNPGVSEPLTPAKTTASGSGKFPASDPVKFPPQEPLAEEPMHAGQRAPLCEVFKPRQIETWERLVNKVWTSKGIAAAGDPKALLDAELDLVWPL